MLILSTVTYFGYSYWRIDLAVWAIILTVFDTVKQSYYYAQGVQADSEAIGAARLPVHLFTCPICGHPFKAENVCISSRDLLLKVCARILTCVTSLLAVCQHSSDLYGYMSVSETRQTVF